MVFIDATLVWGVPIRLRGDHGVENLYAAQWMENYRGVLSNPYIWGHSVHNTRGERMWVETSRSWADRWHEFFTELEASYGLDHENSAHIWLVLHLFLADIDEAACQWADEWNNHKIPLQAIPNMGVNQEILTLLQQRHQALTPDVLAHLQDGHEDASLPVNLPTQSLAYVPCEAPACPLSPVEVDVLNQTMATSLGMASNTWEARRVHWIHGLETLNAILAHRRG
ncbi:uncharacterized protein EV420DRAFT_1673406 [Desarmillaria tabescens]|uniref:Integrase core domain-containing protein n=1 Tax=Armillaria tabescens TaxID=1929756 RepID=A0AA39N6Q6_ARMTA|nr:uncharacterized protein EV420DRAFT_1673406 [Desarmillaria tabescens]KAK0460231.1 hypothetical protein EV420DRAFT_1673406 [Desarmillaria tabescens]